MTAELFWMILAGGMLIGFVIGGAVVNNIYRRARRSQMGAAWVHYRQRRHDR